VTYCILLAYSKWKSKARGTRLVVEAPRDAVDRSLNLERAMGIEPIANSLSPVESVGLTLLEDLIWAQGVILRPSWEKT
jgi:hypothetical protein